MRSRVLVFSFNLILLFQLASSYAQNNYDKFFVDKTMRIDFFHTGTKGSQVISLDKIYEEPAVMPQNKKMWAGNKVNLLDILNLGKYQVKVFDEATKQIIFSKGFSSVFGEWETTDEAGQGMYRTFHETVLFPFPKEKILLTISARDKENNFQDIFSTDIDPNSRFVNREWHCPSYKVQTLLTSGYPHNKVDLVFLGDGYTKS